MKDSFEEKFIKDAMRNASICTEASASTLTMETLLEIIGKLPKCPIAEFMKSKGADPKDGWVLVVPESIAAGITNIPSYVCISKWCPVPKLIRASTGLVFKRGIKEVKEPPINIGILKDLSNMA